MFDGEILGKCFKRMKGLTMDPQPQYLYCEVLLMLV